MSIKKKRIYFPSCRGNSFFKDGFQSLSLSSQIQPIVTSSVWDGVQFRGNKTEVIEKWETAVRAGTFFLFKPFVPCPFPVGLGAAHKTQK